MMGYRRRNLEVRNRVKRNAKRKGKEEINKGMRHECKMIGSG